MNRPVFAAIAAASLLVSAGASAAPYFFSTGAPNGQMAMASRPAAASAGLKETEAADDFITTSTTRITSASFTGLVPLNATVAQVLVEIYRVFPKDSTVPPSGNVPTRNNSPSDVAFDTRDSLAGALTFTTTDLGTFAASNSVDLGIHPFPNQQTGGDGGVSGQELVFDVTFTTPFLLPADHYFFVPQVLLGSPNDHFLWLSGERPLGGVGTTPFAPDLQAWIRNDDLAPDWLRVGQDIIGGSPFPTFNGSFALVGATVPEPASWALMLLGLAGLGLALSRAAGLRRA